MIFNEIKPNNRLQFECENENPLLRNVKGIVLGVVETSIIIVTDYGDLLEIPEEKVLSITKINFDKIVSDNLTEIKNHYSEIYEMEMKLEELKKNEGKLRNNLYDANFLAKFNIFGSKNRLDSSIDSSLIDFKKDTLEFKTSFVANPNNQIELIIKVFNSFEYYNLDEVGDVDKIIRVHAPNVKDVIEKSFSFKCLVEELEKKVAHENESIYSVSTLYKMKIDVSEQNFLSVRDEIVKGLIKLKN